MKGYLRKLTVLVGLTILGGLGIMALGGGLAQQSSNTWFRTAYAEPIELPPAGSGPTGSGRDQLWACKRQGSSVQVAS